MPRTYDHRTFAGRIFRVSDSYRNVSLGATFHDSALRVADALGASGAGTIGDLDGLLISDIAFLAKTGGYQGRMRITNSNVDSFFYSAKKDYNCEFAKI